MTRRSHWIALSVVLGVVVTSEPVASGSPESRRYSTTQVLERLGGKPCADGSAFTCISVTMPLDHRHPGDGRTTDVVFAVLPASGERRGMFVTLTGGPGTSGVSSAEPYTALLDPSLTRHFDSVYLDQRGVKLSGGIDCLGPVTEWYESDWRAGTRRQESAVAAAASGFVRACLRGLTPESASLLPYVGTDQATEDLEHFRRLMGDDRFWLYGESYGSEFAQQYAADHGDHLAGLILDGTVDRTLDAVGFFRDQTLGSESVLIATLAACNDEPACAKDMGADAVDVFDRLMERLESGEIPFRFPDGAGGFADRRFTFADLVFVANGFLRTPANRTSLNRALAAWAARNDLVPLAFLLYSTLGIDPETLAPEPNPASSDAMYYGVRCRDWAIPGRTRWAKAEYFLRNGDDVEDPAPRLASGFNWDLPCAFWPTSTSDPRRPRPLRADGIPTLVLASTTDPATPYQEGYAVFRRLDDGYLVTQTNGPHVIFEHGSVCVDDLVTQFLVTGRPPAQRKTVCDGTVTEPYEQAPGMATDQPKPGPRTHRGRGASRQR